MTVREMLRTVQVEMRDGGFEPAKAREMLVKLSGLLGNVMQEAREADFEYALVLSQCYEEEGKGNRAEIRAKTTPQYRRLREAKDAEKLCIELTRSLKASMRSLEEEMRLSR